MMTRLMSLFLMTALVAPGCAPSLSPRLAAVPAARPGAQAPEPTEHGADTWRRFALALPVGSVVRVELADGTRLKGTLMVVEPEAMVVKPKTRLREPARRILFTTVESIETERGGLSAGKAVVIGVAAGAASFVAFFVMAVTLLSD